MHCFDSSSVVPATQPVDIKYHRGVFSQPSSEDLIPILLCSLLHIFLYLLPFQSLALCHSVVVLNGPVQWSVVIKIDPL